MGVTQTYIIVFDACVAETTKPYYVLQKNTSIAKCSAYVIAVNGAGESYPSKNVSIPSLPDVGPVTASLTHQVWKDDGEIRVNVSFKVRHCHQVIVIYSYYHSRTRYQKILRIHCQVMSRNQKCADTEPAFVRILQFYSVSRADFWEFWRMRRQCVPGVMFPRYRV